MSTKRSFPEWVRYRVSRIPRKLAFARHRLLWIWKDIANGIRIWWEVRLWKRPLADITRYERRVWSENGEDGILEAIFMAVGTTNKTFVEFGSGDLHECNTRYLATWKGWRGLWMDAMYIDQSHRVKRERVTAENIEALFAKYHIPKAFDLLSIDVDGNDYWIWKAITTYAPRVIVIEYNSSVPPDQSKTVAYDPAFQWDAETSYFGASLLALQRLGNKKGYALVGCDSSGTNAFFVRQSLIQGRFLLRDIRSVYRPPTCWDGRGHPPHPQRTMLEV